MRKFRFSDTFVKLNTMPIYLQPSGWISPLWHATELGRYFSYGYSISAQMLIIHFAFLLALLVGGFALANRTFTTRLTK